MKLSLRQGRYLLVALLSLGVLGLFAAARPLRDLRIHVNDLDFLPAGSPALAADQAIRERFGSDERLIIAFESVERDLLDPAFREDLDFFLRRLARSYNINRLLFDRLFRPRFEPR